LWLKCRWYHRQFYVRPWVTQGMPYDERELLCLREHMRSLQVFFRGYIFLVCCVVCVYYYLIRYVSCAKCCECLWMLDRFSLTLICDICCPLFTNGVREEEERFWPGYIIYKIYNSSILQIKINFICTLNILVH
jgi:hypothetical protein